MGDRPEEQEGDSQRDRKECGQPVCRLMVKNAVMCLTGGISNEGRDVLELNVSEVDSRYNLLHIRS